MEIQLEFNLENKTPHEMQLSLMQNQIDQMCESMGKVRRKLFSEMGELKKLQADLKKENEELRAIVSQVAPPTEEWVYKKDGYLFELKKVAG